MTNAERSLDWLWGISIMIVMWPILWIGSCRLIWIGFLEPQLYPVDEIISMIGLPLSLLAIVTLLVIFIFKAARLTFVGTQREQLVSLQQTNIVHNAIFWNLVLEIVYRARYWLTGLIGVCPYFLWLICQCYFIWALPGDLRCFPSLLGHTYCYSDGPPVLARQLELFWFVSLTLGILGLTLGAILCCIGLTMKSRKPLLSTAGVLAFVLPLLLGIILIVAVEGFLAADTAYGSAAVDAAIERLLPAGVAMAVLPFIASLIAQGFLQRWAFK